MGGDASRVGKIKKKAPPLNNCCTIPDAGRVAPIRACVSSSTKRYHQVLPQNATSNGGDASRRKYAVIPYNYQCSLSKTLQMLSASSPTM